MFCTGSMVSQQQEDVTGSTRSNTVISSTGEAAHGSRDLSGLTQGPLRSAASMVRH